MLKVFLPFLFLTTLQASTFLTNFTTTTSPPRNDFSGYVGMQFTVGSTGFFINSLGRICVSGNQQTHLVKIIQVNNQDFPNGSVTVNMANCTNGQFVYTSLPTSIQLVANTTYSIVSQEVMNGDQWYDTGLVTPTNDGKIIGPIYSNDGITWNVVGVPNYAYVPLNFTYSLQNASIVGLVALMSDGSQQTIQLGQYLQIQNGVLKLVIPNQYVNEVAQPQSDGSWTFLHPGRNIQVWRNGLLQRPLVDYNVDSSQQKIIPILVNARSWGISDYILVNYLW